MEEAHIRGIRSRDDGRAACASARLNLHTRKMQTNCDIDE